jgi:hypothetical protein
MVSMECQDARIIRSGFSLDQEKKFAATFIALLVTTHVPTHGLCSQIMEIKEISTGQGTKRTTTHQLIIEQNENQMVKEMY